jgi:hypothetical protein
MLVSVLLILANTSVANPVIGRSPCIFNDGDGGRRVRLRESNSSFEALLRGSKSLRVVDL